MTQSLISRAQDDFCYSDDTKCRNDHARKGVSIINSGRAIRREFGRGYYSKLVEEKCEAEAYAAIQAGKPQWNACFASYDLPTGGQVRAALGVKTFGPTRDGYYALRTGMTLEEVEATLGQDYDEISSASSGGYSVRMYQWNGRRGGTIIVTLSDWLMSAKAQHGL